MKLKNGEFLFGDCLELMKNIPNSSIDMILCDLPYGLTANVWDNLIDIDILWKEYLRIIKPNCAIVLTCIPPFSFYIGNSQLELFKHSFVWNKNIPTNFLNAKNQPLRIHEDILVFSIGKVRYFPQGLIRKHRFQKRKTSGNNWGNQKI